MISKDFLLAGNATFTVSNPEGKHYTYKVQKAKTQLYPDRPAFFIKALTGADNENSYTYLGMVKETGVRLTRASKYHADSTIYRVAHWAVKHIINGVPVPTGYKIDHAGTCGRCGRKLTTPESIALGLGPVCAGLS